MFIDENVGMSDCRKKAAGLELARQRSHFLEEQCQSLEVCNDEKTAWHHWKSRSFSESGRLRNGMSRTTKEQFNLLSNESF